MNNIRIDDSSKIIGKLRSVKEVHIAQDSIIRFQNDSATIGNTYWVLEKIQPL